MGKEKTEISLKRLEEIAEYYEFPLAVFFAPEGTFKKGTTRNQEIAKRAEAFDKIKEIVDGE